MSVDKHHNHDYDGASPSIPLATGDRYYAQDLGRDFNFHRDSIGQIVKSLGGSIPMLLEGGEVSKGTGDTLNITPGKGCAKFEVTIPNDSTVLPATIIAADLESVLVEWTQQTNMAIASATLDGATPNFVKARYKETDSATRARAKKAGSYVIEKIPSFEIIVNSTSPTDYDIVLGEFVGTASGTFYFLLKSQVQKPIFSLQKIIESFYSNWTIRASAADENWNSVCYGNGLFVAVAVSGTQNRAMTSPDGITWTIRTTPVEDNNWNSVCYGNGLFVAVAFSGTQTRAMTSPDGITWTTRTTPVEDNNWYSVCYGNGLFVAVAVSGTQDRVMTSPDGITWTIRTTPVEDNDYRSVCYGNGLFVAVASTGTGTRVMTSLNGITWTTRTSAANEDWYSVCYGNGLFVAVANSGTGNRVMTSPDGIVWTIQVSAANNDWRSVCYGNGLFVAVAKSGAGNRVMTSLNGIVWTVRTSTIANNWYSVCYENGLFVAVAEGTGTGNRVMTSLQMTEL